jgi:hypothetical protein
LSRETALKRLEEQSRYVERQTSNPPIEELIAQERRFSHSYGGRSVFGWERPPQDWADANDVMVGQASMRTLK